MSHQFISYARKDRTFVRSLVKALGRLDCKVWMDSAIQYSAKWWDEIQTAIERADGVIFVLSPTSAASQWCNRELDYARSLGKRIIPVVYLAVDEKQFEEQVEGEAWKDIALQNRNYLRQIQHIAFHHPDDKQFQGDVDTLLQTIRQEPEYAQNHTRFTVWASEWKRQERNPSFLLRGDNLLAAQTWLEEARDKEPQPRSLQRAYIKASAEREAWERAEEHRKRLITRRLTLASILFALVAALAGSGIVIAAVLLRDALFKNQVAQAFNEHAIGSNRYLLNSWSPNKQSLIEGAKVRYEASLALLNPNHEPWSKFNEPLYTSNGVNIGLWLYDMGVVCAQLPEHYDDCAIPNLEAAVETGTDYTVTDARLALAGVYLAKGQYAEVEKQLGALSGQAGDYFTSIQMDMIRGIMAYKQGNKQWKKATALLRQVHGKLDIDWTEPDMHYFSTYQLEILYYLATIYQENDETIASCSYWKEYNQVMLIAPPTNPYVPSNAHRRAARDGIQNCSKP